MANNQDTQAVESAYNQEWAYIKGRQFLLIILALGSMIVTYRIGGYVADLIAPGDGTVNMFIRSFFVFLSCVGVDWVLATALSSASNVNENAVASNKKPLWAFVAFAFATTLALSLVSNIFIGQDMAGDSYLNGYNAKIERAMVQDSTLKAMAFTALDHASDEQKTRLKEAKKEQATLLKAAIAAGSSSWQEDYQAYKNNDEAWFWKCTSCAREYRAYRDGIKKAIADGNQLVADARGYAGTVQQSLAPTLSYTLSSDSTLVTLKANTMALESERKSRASMITTILFVMSIGCGILALLLTFVLRQHRVENGQQIIEDNVRPVMIVLDIVGRVGGMIADLLYSMYYVIFEIAQNNGWIKTYQLKGADVLTRVAAKPLDPTSEVYYQPAPATTPTKSNSNQGNIQPTSWSQPSPTRDNSNSNQPVGANQHTPTKQPPNTSPSPTGQGQQTKEVDDTTATTPTSNQPVGKQGSNQLVGKSKDLVVKANARQGDPVGFSTKKELPETEIVVGAEGNRLVRLYNEKKKETEELDTGMLNKRCSGWKSKIKRYQALETRTPEEQMAKAAKIANAQRWIAFYQDLMNKLS